MAEIKEKQVLGLQVFRLVDPGRVDRVIAFDKLPEDILHGVRRGPAHGFARHWHKFLGSDPKDKNARPFYILDFKMLNADIEKWQEISQYVRRSTEREVRLLDKLEDMAKPFAPDAYSPVDLEPEDIVVIPLIAEGDDQAPDEPQVKEEKSLNKKVNEKVNEYAVSGNATGVGKSTRT